MAVSHHDATPLAKREARTPPPDATRLPTAYTHTHGIRSSTAVTPLESLAAERYDHLPSPELAEILLSYQVQNLITSFARKEGVLHRDCDVTVPLGAAERGLEPLLLMIDEQIAITSDEYDEAWTRLRGLKAALIEGFRERVYINGSIEHGDALTPLNDIDLGIIFGEPLAALERRRSPTGLMERACEVIEASAKDQYPGISADFTGQKRSVVVQFGTKSFRKRQDFTADVIVALDYREGRGVLVPNLLKDGWDRSDPIAHSKMVHHANSLTDLALNRVVRLVKQWNRRSGQPLSSWNIKALALSCLTRPTTLTEGLHTFFHYATQALASGLTPDPAGIASPIGLELPRPQVLACLRKACSTLDKVIMSADSGRLAEMRDSLETFLAVSLVEVDSEQGVEP